VSRKPRIRVLVAEDDASVRDALEAVFRAERSVELTASVGDATGAVEAAARERPDVALVGVRMPGGGVQAAREIRSCSPKTRVLAFTAHNDPANVLEMLEAGAVGYVVKGNSIDGIVDEVVQAAAGKSSLSVEVTRDVIETLVGQLGVQRKAAEKTERQEKRIRRALDEENSFRMVFQPIFSLSGGMAGAEALARFRGPPKRGAEYWFAEADAVCLRRELELATMKAALSALPDLPAGIYLSFNVSPKTLLSAGFRKLVLECSDPARVVIEVTEHARIDNYERLNAAFDRVRKVGVRLAVDDAGAGFASLRHILRLAPDFIKLDRTLIAGIESDRSRQALAAGLISFAARIDATIIAEGIEEFAEVDMLTSLGVGHGQGFLLARPGPLPLPPADTSGLRLAAHRRPVAV
jgi:EAL domain-containing protein (putative c-di-GMP-specific phosphodiesterase class I)/DNA-binding NarL/FixJ family response regulator